MAMVLVPAERRPLTRDGETAASEEELGSAVLLHAEVYRALRFRLGTGKIVPGIRLSTRGLAQELGVSQMPVREALSRLAAEGAIQIRSRRKIIITPMTPDRFADVLRCRVLLEPEAAKLALPQLDKARQRQLRVFDAAMDAALETGDVSGYMEANYNFHFTIYRAQDRRTLNQLIETLWLQFGPYMRVVYGRFGTANLIDQHRVALEAIERGDAEALGHAIRADIEDGMGIIGKNGLTEPDLAD
jgi:DNA-binding GntR family transcriptional regulator